MKLCMVFFEIPELGGRRVSQNAGRERHEWIQFVKGRWSLNHLSSSLMNSILIWHPYVCLLFSTFANHSSELLRPCAADLTAIYFWNTCLFKLRYKAWILSYTYSSATTHPMGFGHRSKRIPQINYEEWFCGTILNVMHWKIGIRYITDGAKQTFPAIVPAAFVLAMSEQKINIFIKIHVY